MDAGRGLLVRVSVLMFLQFFLWGGWFVTLFQVLAEHGLAGMVGDAYGSAPLGALVAPLFLGLVADRWFAAERVMACLFGLGGVLLACVPGALAAGDGTLVVGLLVGHMLCFMPTLGLANTVAFAHLGAGRFPRARVWGTIGWIFAGLAVGFLGWSSSDKLFWLSSASAILLGVYCLTLPATPPAAAGERLDLRGLLMVDAWRLLRRPAVLVFMLASTLICIPLAYYYSNTSGFLANMGVSQPASAMSIGQMSELLCMLAVPWFFRRLGVKWMILVGMLAWVVRYLLFAWGAPGQVAWMLYAGIALHGVCYDFFFVTGFMYTERVAPREVRSQAQSLLVFFTQGLGMWIGFKVADWQLAPVRPVAAKLADAQALASAGAPPSFTDQLAQMFAIRPVAVDPQLLAQAASLWRSYWLGPACMAALVALGFWLAFRERPGDGSSK